MNRTITSATRLKICIILWQLAITNLFVITSNNKYPSLHFPCTWSKINITSPIIFFSFYFGCAIAVFCRKSFLMLIIRRMTGFGGKDVIILKLTMYSYVWTYIINIIQPPKECLCEYVCVYSFNHYENEQTNLNQLNMCRGMYTSYHHF